jgi:hypothetical protein
MVRLLCGVSANKGFCGLNARLPVRWAGFTECGSILSQRFVGMIEFSGMIAFVTFFAAIPLAVWRGVGGSMYHYGVWEMVSFTLAVGRTALCVM